MTLIAYVVTREIKKWQVVWFESKIIPLWGTQIQKRKIDMNAEGMHCITQKMPACAQRNEWHLNCYCTNKSIHPLEGMAEGTEADSGLGK